MTPGWIQGSKNELRQGGTIVSICNYRCPRTRNPSFHIAQMTSHMFKVSSGGRGDDPSTENIIESNF